MLRLLNGGKLAKISSTVFPAPVSLFTKRDRGKGGTKWFGNSIAVDETLDPRVPLTTAHGRPRKTYLVRHLLSRVLRRSLSQVGIRVFEGIPDSSFRQNRRVGSRGTPMNGVETTMELRKCTRVIHRSSCWFLGNAFNSQAHLPLVFLPSILPFFPSSSFGGT